MRRLERYWRTNKSWYHHVDGKVELTESAPEEARKSFEIYRKQIEEMYKNSDSIDD